MQCWYERLVSYLKAKTKQDHFKINEWESLMSFNDPSPGNDNILHVIVSNVCFKLLLLTVKQKLPALSVVAA